MSTSTTTRIGRHLGTLAPRSPRLACALLAAALLAGAGCHSDMYEQPRYETFEYSEFFADGQSARHPVPGTVARGHLFEDEAFYAGKVNGVFIPEIPIEPEKIDLAFLARGQERFNIYCSMCHGRTGYGNGMIVQRGFRQPPSLHIDRLRAAPAGHFYDVITNGFGTMPDYSPQVPPLDRWAIIAYIRALQLSQNAEWNELPPELRAALGDELQEAAR